MNEIVNSKFPIGSIVVWKNGRNPYFAIVIGRSLLWELAPGYHCDIEHPVFICYFMENGSYGHTAVGESDIKRASSIFSDTMAIGGEIFPFFDLFKSYTARPDEYIDGFIRNVGFLHSFVRSECYENLMSGFFGSDINKKIALHLAKSK